MADASAFFGGPGAPSSMTVGGLSLGNDYTVECGWTTRPLGAAKAWHTLLAGAARQAMTQSASLAPLSAGTWGNS